MAIVKCNNGHFYDDVLYHGRCPHCKAESELLKAGKTIDEDDKTVAMTQEEIHIQTGQAKEIPLPLPGQNAESGQTTASAIGQMFDKALSETYAPAGLEEEDEDKTLSFFSGSQTVEPVTGWLVCVSGNENGKDYRLHTGKNFIGRSLTMDVPIVGDKTVARNKHCSVIYDPKHNTFYLSGESGNIVYLNDKTIENFVQLKENDVLRVGMTELVFVPYCKEERQWKE
jgi:hypothetical protein